MLALCALGEPKGDVSRLFDSANCHLDVDQLGRNGGFLTALALSV